MPIDVLATITSILNASPDISDAVGTRVYAWGKQGDAKTPYLLYHPVAFIP